MNRSLTTAKAVGTAIFLAAVHLACYAQNGGTEPDRSTSNEHTEAAAQCTTSEAQVASTQGEQPLGAYAMGAESSSAAGDSGKPAAPSAPTDAASPAKPKPGFFTR